MPVGELVARWEALGAKPLHAREMLRAWLAGAPLAAGGARGHRRLPATVSAELDALEAELAALARVASEHPSDDGSVRLLVELARGRSVESVLLARGAVCVSTQEGCAVGCTFCKTGESGLLSQLDSAEILAQVVLARRRRAVRRVVFMGMGEPLHNLGAVLEAAHQLGTAGGIAHKDLVVSTVGEPAAFERMAEGAVKPALALSLHTTDDALRRELLPRAPRVPVEELVDAAGDYGRRTGHPVQVQWTLLDGLNDTDAEAERAIALFRGRRMIVNFIPWNAVEGAPHGRPPIERAVDLVRTLKRGGVVATLRRSGGQDVDGACGQLRARARKRPERAARAARSGA